MLFENETLEPIPEAGLIYVNFFSRVITLDKIYGGYG